MSSGEIVKGRRVYSCSYEHTWERVSCPGAGTFIPCDEYGKVPSDKEERFEEFWTDPDLVYKGVGYREEYIGTLCSCGSGEIQNALYDYQGIFLNYVCPDCERDIRSRYRPEVFAGYSQADLDEYSGERIEEDW